MSDVPLEEVRDSLIPDLCALIVEYCEPVCITPERVQSTKQYLLSRGGWLRSTQPHPHEVVKLRLCPDHFRCYNDCDYDEDTFCSGCSATLNGSTLRLPTELDVLGRWNEQLSASHQCHSCTRLFRCKPTISGPGLCSCERSHETWYCGQCVPVDWDREYDELTREYEIEQLKLFHRQFILQTS